MAYKLPYKGMSRIPSGKGFTINISEDDLKSKKSASPEPAKEISYEGQGGKDYENRPEDATNTFSSVAWAFTSVQNQGSYSATITSSVVQINEIFSFFPTQQLPELKIIDFLTGLFKMFNLTAYIDNDIIKVDSLDAFYSTFETYDITKYIDVNSSAVNIALPYRQINFNYADYDTYFAKTREKTGLNDL